MVDCRRTIENENESELNLKQATTKWKHLAFILFDKIQLNWIMHNRHDNVVHTHSVNGTIAYILGIILWTGYVRS